MYVGVRNGYRKKGGLPNVLQVQVLYPTVYSTQYNIDNLMQTKVNNQGEQLKVKRINYLTPPYTKPSNEERKRWEQSKQLSILPPLQPTPKELLQHQQLKNPNQLIPSKPKPKKQQKSKPAPKLTAKPVSRTLTFGDTTIELPRDQHKLEARSIRVLEESTGY